MPLQETTLTDEIIDRVCSHLRKHAFRETAIACAGVSKFTVRNWIRQGVRDQNAGTESIFSKFVEQMDAAEREAEAELIDGIQKRGLEAFTRSMSTYVGKDGDEKTSETYEPPDWKALAWIAERRGAKRWGIKKHITMALEQDRTKLLDAVEKTLGEDALIKLSAALAAQDADDDGAGEGGETEGEE